MLEFLKAPFLVLHFSCYTLMTFMMMLSVILVSMLMILLSTLSVNWHLISELAFELKSNLRNTVDWGRNWLVNFNVGKTQLVSFDQSNESGAIDVKMDESVPEEKPSFKMLEFSFSSKLDWGSYIFSVAKTVPKENWSFDLL